MDNYILIIIDCGQVKAVRYLPMGYYCTVFYPDEADFDCTHFEAPGHILITVENERVVEASNLPNGWGYTVEDLTTDKIYGG